jgi:hypothetical protein
VAGEDQVQLDVISRNLFVMDRSQFELVALPVVGSSSGDASMCQRDGSPARLTDGSTHAGRAA